jgi:hypothetical protein
MRGDKREGVCSDTVIQRTFKEKMTGSFNCISTSTGWIGCKMSVQEIEIKIAHADTESTVNYLIFPITYVDTRGAYRVVSR